MRAARLCRRQWREGIMNDSSETDGAGPTRRGALSMIGAGVAAAAGASSAAAECGGPTEMTMDTSIKDPMGSGLPNEADVLLRAAPPPPFDWVREGTSFWMFDESGEFGFPRAGVEAEPWSWDNRFCQSNLVFADGRQLIALERGPAPPILDANGHPMVIGCGPLTMRCIEPFHRWHVRFDGMAVESHVREQIDGTIDVGAMFAGTVDPKRKVPLTYEFEMRAVVPANVMDHSPEKFFKFGKGKQRDAASVGLGWRFEQMMRGEGELTVDGGTRPMKLNGNRIKRRSVRTDSLFLRGHCWQAVVFPDGRAAGYEARPPHDDGYEPYNEGFVYQDGRMYHARATKVPWFRKLMARGDDVSFELESELGTTRVEGTTELSTFMLSNEKMHGLDLQQAGVRYTWGGQSATGMIERSATPGQLARS
jgi:hypothetical protein